MGRPSTCLRPRNDLLQSITANVTSNTVHVSGEPYCGRPMKGPLRRRWRFYESRAGRRPVRDFLDSLSDTDAASVVEEMRTVAHRDMRQARHLRGDIYEVRADGDSQTFRILFALEGHRGQILLALEGISKKTARTPPHILALAERRLADWRSRSRR
jgi:phage-related protein